MVALIYGACHVVMAHLEIAEIIGETRYSAVPHYCIHNCQQATDRKKYLL